MTSTILKNEYAGSLCGVPGRFHNVIKWPDGDTFGNQRFTTEARRITGYGKGATIRAKLRFDDNPRNGHNTFAITAEIRDPHVRQDSGIVACGCLHDDIAKAFPELARLIRWHLVSTKGPMHHIANTIYLAGDRDHNGLRAGEKRQIRNGKTGMLAWELVAVDDKGETINRRDVPQYVDSETQPEAGLRLEYRPWWRIGEGKARDLDAARRTAVWPDATDADLMQEPAALKAALEARLPALLAEFKADMLAAGFMWDLPA